MDADPSPWRSAGYRRLWTAASASLMGTQVTVLALPLTAIAVLGSSPAEVALLAAAGTAPLLLVGLPAGAWVDRFPRRLLMVWADLIRFALLASIPLAFWLHCLTLAQLYAVAFAVGAVGVFFDVASLTVLPELVDPRSITAANSHLEGARATAQTVGPALGGLLVQAFAAPVALALDAATYLASALLLRGLPPLPPPAQGSERRGLFRTIGDGLAFCFTHPYIRPLAAAGAWINFWTEALLAVFLSHAVTDLGLTPAVIGLVLGCASVGYLAGSLIVPAVNRRLGVGSTIILGVALQLGFGVAALAPATTPLPWVLAGFGLHAIGISMWNVNAVSLRQATTPRPMLARMNATNRFLLWGTMPLGASAGAVLASCFGMNVAVVVAGFAVPLCAVPLLFSRLTEVQRMPAPATDPTGPSVQPVA